MNQPLLFPTDPPPPPPSDPHVAEDERPRLTGQNAAVLERLRRGPATNRELAGISLKYTSKRKLYARIYARVTGSTWVDEDPPEELEAPAEVVEAINSDQPLLSGEDNDSPAV